jgi:AraC-like DNA-binding protein
MDKHSNDRLSYLTISNRDEDWGIVVTTVGFQFVKPGSRYPLSRHPDNYEFEPQKGRILNEYQLVYITRGSGFFSSQSCKQQKIGEGTMILLFPGEWHSYYPSKETGWDEYWVGFRGPHIDRRVQNRFFTREEPLHHIGISSTIISLYDEILNYSTEEKAGFQEMISSIVLHILGSVYYKERNHQFADSEMVNKIKEAQTLMKPHSGQQYTPEMIANHLGLSYSSFRSKFKEYTGSSPAHYQNQQRLLAAKELLTGSEKNVSEIAYMLQFESVGQFSTFFRQREGITPTVFRERNH